MRRRRFVGLCEGEGEWRRQLVGMRADVNWQDFRGGAHGGIGRRCLSVHGQSVRGWVWAGWVRVTGKPTVIHTRTHDPHGFDNPCISLVVAMAMAFL
jgi:hypothetical protein